VPASPFSFVLARSRKTAAATNDATAIHAVEIATGGRGYHSGRANAQRHGAKFSIQSLMARRMSAPAGIGTMAMAA